MERKFLNYLRKGDKMSFIRLSYLLYNKINIQRTLPDEILCKFTPNCPHTVIGFSLLLQNYKTACSLTWKLVELHNKSIYGRLGWFFKNNPVY